MGEITFDLVDRPTMPIELPEWVTGAKINWMEKYSNPPSIELLCAEYPDWGEKPIYQHIGEYFIAKSKDGRCRTYKHGGRIGMHTHRVWVSERTGQVSPHPRQGEAGRWEDRPMLSTTRSDGFGGSKIFITLDDGRDLILWGPWSAGNPSGYQESALWIGKGNKIDRKRLSGVASAFSHDLIIRAAAVYLPHVELALVTNNGRTSLEAILPGLWVPKCVAEKMKDRARDLIMGKKK